MKIGIIGYGKMGQTIQELALQRGHQIAAVVDVNSEDTLEDLVSREVKVVIEFTSPAAAVQNITFCLDHDLPIVSGTTGWLDQLEDIKTICSTRQGAFFYASNFSIGVNIFFAVNRFVAKQMNTRSQYQIFMKEVHHPQKLDAPSGTAITLAEDIIELVGRKTQWINFEEAEENEISIVSERLEGVPGTHVVEYASVIDTIEIKHTAHSREGFASGALDAAEWIVGRNGVFTMQDMLGF
ncbi:MAG: 4-hydroxy-tetrahydrodipicolinate reductase [Saprospiraceae bacterium]|nr:4-hydroxy-tetrahydrodipicolinate reductase [Saprospiraceae bacterium]